ncbi:hypothetical protein KA078_04085 [Candidatus Woesebacteria bacterium]|nr:hypothetical protein [Candidatus Woesebacteria bacterium]
MNKKALIFFSIFFFCSVAGVRAVEYSGGCTEIGQCVNNKLCIVTNRGEGATTVGPVGASCGSGQLGKVRLPPGYTQYVTYENGDYTDNGLVKFASRIMRVFIIICGIWTLFNFLMAGWTYISGMENPKAQQEVKDKLTMTVIGLVILTTSFTLAGLFGLIFFKDATFILSPVIKGAVDFAAPSP